MSDRSITRVRHEVRMRLLEVVKVDRVNPRLVRITLGGEHLLGFSSHGFDDHVKVFIPPVGEIFTELPMLGPDGPIFKTITSNPEMRDYTPHHYDAEALTLQLDFALHDDGAATSWAQNAEVGDTLVIGGPRSSFVIGSGIDWHLLIGDETALPAIRRRCAELPQGSHVIVFVEVNGKEDEEPIKSAANVELHWVHRKSSQKVHSYLVAALHAAVFPKGDCYAWIACESGDAKALRAALLLRGVDKASLKAAGYWRRGTIASHEVHE